MIEKRRKFVCKDCEAPSYEQELLKAPNPFLNGDTLIGCPACSAVNSMRVACDEVNCWEEVVCGYPTKAGYRNTCSEHYQPDPVIPKGTI